MSNPIDEYKQEKLSAKAQRKQHELDLWSHWMQNGQQPEHLAPLLKLYEPIIGQHVRKHKVLTIPESALRGEVQTHVINAFKTYDPNRGAALNTWVESRLPKAGRYRNRYQNLAYIPEGQAGHIGKIEVAKNTLTEELGREPTLDELGDHLGMTPKRLEVIMKAVKRDVPLSRSAGADSYDYTAGATPTGHGFEDQQIAVAKNILPDIFPNKPEMHQLFHYTFGTGGYPLTPKTGDVAKLMGKTEPQISRMKTIMGDTLRKHMGLNDEEDK